METKTVTIPNIGCDGCVKTIQAELSEIDGVQQVDGVTDAKTITVQWDDPATWTRIVEVLTEIEYPPEG